MESRNPRSNWLRHPLISAGSHSWLAGAATLTLGAFLAGGWFAAIVVLCLVRAAQSVLRTLGRGAGGGTIGLV